MTTNSTPVCATMYHMETIELTQTETFHISEYRVERCYGGPEEGGWWYDWCDFMGVAATRPDEESAYHLARIMNAQTGEEQRGHIWGGPDTVYYVEREEGAHQTTETPHYC